ncbi:MAG TPA: biopolymer transporter ExbD [Verrucomicrobiae bacterium]|jgi:biopolymer transport protein ExbD
MQFTTSKRRQTPVVIIISLIDVLIVVLIFLMVTTTFKQQAAVQLALPESNQTNKAGASENMLTVTIPKQGPLYLRRDPITLEKLQAAFQAAAKANPNTVVDVRADTDAGVGQLFKVKDAAEQAGIKSVVVETVSGQARAATGKGP